jgi:hypothetical protein
MRRRSCKACLKSNFHKSDPQLMQMRGLFKYFRDGLPVLNKRCLARNKPLRRSYLTSLCDLYSFEAFYEFASPSLGSGFCQDM